MHELSVTEGILEITLRFAKDADAKQVTDIHLVIGKFSSIIDDSVQFYWDTIAEGTIAEHARLHFNRIAPEITCQDCGEVSEPVDEDLACKNCSSIHVTLTKGNEFRVESIVINE